MQWAFGALFGLFGLAALGIATYETVRAHESADWPTVEGTVTATRVERTTHRHSTGGSRTASSSEDWIPVIEYRYRVAGVERTASRWRFGDRSVDTASEARRIVEGHPVGATVRVAYDPADPARAVLEPGDTGDLWIMFLLGFVFTGLGVGIPVGMRRSVSRRAGRAPRDRRARPTRGPSSRRPPRD